MKHWIHLEIADADVATLRESVAENVPWRAPLEVALQATLGAYIADRREDLASAKELERRDQLAKARALVAKLEAAAADVEAS
jgi:hypothetical protein